ncbi:MAG: enoyl-CoA hydratase [Gemmatimonadota bacterium]
MSDQVLVERQGAVLDVRLNRPEKRNALTVEMYAALADALEGAERDPELRVVLLSGEGPAFSAGNDLKDFLARPPHPESAPTNRFLESLATGTKPIVAAVHGFAVGIGTTLLLHCDLVYAAEETRFHLPFVPLGLVPEAGSSLLLPERIGPARAAEMLLLAEPLTAEAALDAGLVTRVFPAASLLEEARRLAERLAALPPEAVRETRALLRSGRDVVRHRMRLEARVFGERLRSEEARRAMEAFFQKK